MMNKSQFEVRNRKKNKIWIKPNFDVFFGLGFLSPTLLNGLEEGSWWDRQNGFLKAHLIKKCYNRTLPKTFCNTTQPHKTFSEQHFQKCTNYKMYKIYLLPFLGVVDSNFYIYIHYSNNSGVTLQPDTWENNCKTDGKNLKIVLGTRELAEDGDNLDPLYNL